MDGDTQDLQDSHSETKPEVLPTQYLDSIGVPLMFIDIIAVSQYDKYPG